MTPIPDAPLVILVGGFLGAGKTTLLVEAASRLMAAGSAVALITNDQGGALVDTHLAGASRIDTEEIAGGCFCCRFSELIQAADRLRAHGPDVIFAEPVGSCIDISATVLQPIKRLYGGRYRLAPFTVLADPRRARELLAPGADPYLAYLFTRQLAEADLVCFSKADLDAELPELPGGFALRVSARTGQGISEWLREVLAGSAVAGSRLLRNVDYEKYAEAEAALGWLNWQATLRPPEPLSPAQIVGPLLDMLDRSLTEAGIRIAHLKAFDQCATGFIKASVCVNGDEPEVLGALDASPADVHKLLVNLRAVAAPEALESALHRASATLPGSVEVTHFECFRPSPPKPEYRMEEG